jgi:hypothetical protein
MFVTLTFFQVTLKFMCKACWLPPGAITIACSNLVSKQGAILKVCSGPTLFQSNTIILIKAIRPIELCNATCQCLTQTSDDHEKILWDILSCLLSFSFVTKKKRFSKFAPGSTISRTIRQYSLNIEDLHFDLKNFFLHKITQTLPNLVCLSVAILFMD